MALSESADNLLARLVARHILYTGGARTVINPSTRVRVDFDPSRSSTLQREEVADELAELTEGGFISARWDREWQDRELVRVIIGHDLTEAGVLHFLKPEMKLVTEKDE